MTREQRRLAAIVAADVVGYSRLVGRNESGTVARLREHRKLRLEPVLARHGGRLVKLTGDGALVELASAVDALGAAIEFPQAMAEANRDQPQDNLVVLMVATGFATGLTAGLPEIVFAGSGAPLPPSFAAYPAWVAHFWLAMLLLAFIVLHVGAALHHQFVQRDGLLRRMGFGRQVV